MRPDAISWTEDRQGDQIFVAYTVKEVGRRGRHADERSRNDFVILAPDTQPPLSAQDGVQFIRIVALLQIRFLRIGVWARFHGHDAHRLS